MYIPQLFNSFVRRLLGNGKWYQLRLRSRWHYLFSNQCNNFHKGIFKTFMNATSLVYLKNRALEESTVGFLEISLIIMQFRPQNVILWNRRNGFNHDWAQTACSYMKYFLWMGFFVTLIHFLTLQDVFHFSNSEDMWIFLVNCNKSLTDVLVKPLPIQKSTCLIIRQFNNPENKANTSLHPSLSQMIVLIIFITSITLNIMTNVYILVF